MSKTTRRKTVGADEHKETEDIRMDIRRGKKIPMNLQFFAEGNSDPTAGEGNANPNSGTGEQQPTNTTYTQEQLDGIVNSRVDRAEQSALKSFFQQQGLTQEETTQAINTYKETRKAQQSNVGEIQAQLQQAQQTARQAEVEKQATIEALGLGIEAKTLPYALKMADLSSAVDVDGKVDVEAIKTALTKVLEDVPALKPTITQKPAEGFQQIGAGGQSQSNVTDQMLDDIFGVKK